MGAAPDPQEVYDRAADEGRRRLDLPALEQIATGFIAGVTIIFGIVALGVVDALVAARFGSELGTLAGAVAFGIGVVFLVVGRSELFSENFFDPVAAALERGLGRSWWPLLRLWGAILVLNLVGGALLVALLTVEGALPSGAAEILVEVAEEIASTGWEATLVRAVLAGALITLLSYMLSAADGVAARILVSYLVGVFLALGPFDHVVVSVLHLLFGVWDAGTVGYVDVAANLGLSTVGNLVGGLLLITLTHTAQVRAGRDRSS